MTVEPERSTKRIRDVLTSAWSNFQKPAKDRRSEAVAIPWPTTRAHTAFEATAEAKPGRLKPHQVIYLAGFCVIAAFLITALWEFVIEDMVPFFVLHGVESVEERWEYVLTATAITFLVVSVFSWVTYRAIAEQDRIVEALYESERRFRDYAGSASEWFWEAGPDLRFTALSEQFEISTGIPAKEIIGKRRDELSANAPVDAHWVRHMADLEARRPIRNFEYAYRLPDSTLAYFMISGTPVFDSNGRFLGYRGTGGNITKRKRAEKALRRAHEELEKRVEKRTRELRRTNKALEKEVAERKHAEADLRESEERLKQAIQLSGVGYYVWDAVADHCIYCSEEAAQIHGTTARDYIKRASTLTGGFSFTHPDDRERVRSAFKALRSGREIEMAYRIITPDGEVRHAREIAKPIVDGTGRVIREYGTVQDTTQVMTALEAMREKDERLRELQSQLLHASRISTMGQMSAALAHELNQPLSAIINYTQASRRSMEAEGVASAKAREFADKAAEQADRAGQIIRGLRRLLDDRALSVSAEDVNRAIEEVCPLALIGTRVRSIKVTYDLDKDLPPVAIDKIQIQQVIFNLIRNGIEAMAQSERRNLTITTSRSGSDAVMVAVCDTGIGVPKEVEERLFQPLVTSKAHGMGLGLSISRAIIDSHSGKLWARSGPDGGTTFTFTLPVAPLAVDARRDSPRRVA